MFPRVWTRQAFDESRRRVGGQEERWTLTATASCNGIHYSLIRFWGKCARIKRIGTNSVQLLTADPKKTFRFIERNVTCSRRKNFARSLGYFDRAAQTSCHVNEALNVSFLIISQSRLRKILPSKHQRWNWIPPCNEFNAGKTHARN